MVGASVVSRPVRRSILPLASALAGRRARRAAEARTTRSAVFRGAGPRRRRDRLRLQHRGAHGRREGRVRRPCSHARRRRRWASDCVRRMRAALRSIDEQGIDVVAVRYKGDAAIATVVTERGEAARARGTLALVQEAAAGASRGSGRCRRARRAAPGGPGASSPSERPYCARSTRGSRPSGSAPTTTRCRGTRRPSAPRPSSKRTCASQPRPAQLLRREAVAAVVAEAVRRRTRSATRRARHSSRMRLTT